MTATSRVLVVDVDLSARNGLTRLLRSAGHDALGFASVKEFLHALDPDTSGCLVLDGETVAHGLNAVVLYRKPVDGPALLDAVMWALGPVERA